MVEAPHQAAGISVADPVVNAILLFFDTALEPVRRDDRNKRQREDERAEERERHCVGHRVEQFSGRPGQRVDRQISGDDDGDRIKDRTIDIARGVQNHFVQVVIGAFAFGEFAIDVFDHHDRAVDDDAEVDRADREQVGGFAGSVKKYKGEEKRERNRQSGDHGRPEADEEKQQHEEYENHAAEQIVFDGVGRNANEVAAVVVRMNLYVGRQSAAVELVGFLLDAAQDRLRLLSAPHQDHAFNGVVVFLDLVLKSKNSKARRVADHDGADIFHAHGPAIVAADDDLADIVGRFQQAEAAHVVELSALRVKTASGVRVVRLDRVENVRDRLMKVIEPRRIEQDVILHRRAPEAGVVSNARYAAVRAFDDPVFESVQLH